MDSRGVATLSILFHFLIIAALLCGVATMLANMCCFRSLAPIEPPTDGPLVSILVPARNEAGNIGACAASLLSQDYPNFELIVLNDHSTDATGDILRDLGATVIEGEDLPAGWVGKNWACHQLAQAASGEWLFFTDADTEHAPGAVSAAMAAAQTSQASLLSAWPRLVTGTWSEHLIVPMIDFLAMAIYPHWLLTALQRFPHLGMRLSPATRRQLGVANGQFMFWHRPAYDRVGGHESVHDHLVEDVALGRAVAERMDEGMRLINCDALRFSICRMYRSFGEVWEGFSKNACAIFEERTSHFFLAGAASAACFLWPFVSVLFPGPHRIMAGLAIALIYAIRIAVAARFQTSWLGAVLHPFGFLLGMAIGLNSWRCSRGHGVTWKGRVYPVSSKIDA